MNDETFSNISKIIERDSKTTTYKFALLRGTIDIIQENSPFIILHEDFVEIPLGLLIEKWLIYYYPILDSKIYIPQINGEKTKISFQEQFKKVIDYYSLQGGLSVFYNDLRSKGISTIIGKEFYDLIKVLKDNIVKNPMKYIGNSINKSLNSIYSYNNNSSLKNDSVQNTNWLINGCGTFSIPSNYYYAFKTLGSFISGTDNILFKWAEFSVNASTSNLKTEQALNEILRNPVVEREVEDVRRIYNSMKNNKQELICVWSNRKIDGVIEIDHMIPFSIWKNNDLWNLLPTRREVNGKKSDKIPSKNTLIKQKDLIIYYWDILSQANHNKFMEEIQISLLGNGSRNNWKNAAFEQLLNTSKYLIETRGYEEWII